MKTILLTIAMMCAIFMAQAQKVTLEEKVQKETDGIVAALDLGDEMATAIYDISLKYAEERRTAAKSYKVKEKAGEEVDPTEKKEAMKAFNQQKNKEINELLGKELTKEYRAYRKELAAERKKSKDAKE